MKLLTLVIPSYNVERCLRTCVERMVPAGEEIDVLIVDDGSTDGTPAVADALAAEHPGIVRVIHQPNGGHGEGLNQGIRLAEGIYLKSVDADDRIDTASLRAMTALLREHAEPESQVDLVVNDYVYDRPERECVCRVNYHRVFQPGRTETWDSCGSFPFWKQFMIHSLTYRAALLREHAYSLPQHTFYEDNLYIYQPLPWVRKVLYLHEPLYGYTVGQSSQSVSLDCITKHLDQSTEMTTQMACSYTLEELQSLPRHLGTYMINYAACQILAVSVLHYMANDAESRRLHQEMKDRIHDFDPKLYRRLHRAPSGFAASLPGRVGEKIVIGGFLVGRRGVGF